MNYQIEIASDTIEAEEFCYYLNKNGHDAIIGNTTGNYVDGNCTNSDIDANEIMNGLWSDYCNS